MPSHPSSGPSRPPSPSPSNLPPLPSSPVFSVASTANPISQFNLPLPPAPRPSHAVLTQADLEASQRAYADLVASAKTYRLALAALSQAASQFGAALEACARLKEARAEPVAGPHARHAHAHAHGPNSSSSMTMAMAATSSSLRGICTADTLLSASGVHHLIANHQQILSETVYRSFEVPLLHDLDKWQTVIDDEEETYQAKIKAQSREVKRMEKEGLKLHKQRRRDVARFRAHLVDLTSKLDGLTILHADHSRALLRESQDTSARIVDASCSLVRAEVDIFESLARKGWTGGGLEDLLEMGTDLFANTDEHVVSVGGSGGGGGGGSSTTGAAAASSAGGFDNNNHNIHAHHGNNPYSNGDSSSNKLFSILPPKSILADATSAASSMRLGHSRGDSLLMDSERYQSLAALATEVKQHGGGGAAVGGDADSVMSADFNKPRGARPFSPQPIRRIPADVTLESLAGMSGDGRPGGLAESSSSSSSSESEMGVRREGDAWGD
ncbi:hypothetical protein E4U57_001982 [Claviceps arundinis]|uniref:IVY1-phospholipid-binding protein n=1 Tax=Claviceps arundinis TaxID=1623583 RepID=A0ABQ7PKN0_9HYPO|nr:hypothetical protein E4U57_001982 [Claviceps arundinis]